MATQQTKRLLVSEHTNVAEEDLEAIAEAAARFGIGAVYLFGSSIRETATPADIDIAVEGVPPGVFFKFYGQLSKRLSRPIDVVDLGARNAVTRLIAQEVVKVYG